MPGFIIHILAVIIKQKQLNYLISKFHDTPGKDFSGKVLEELNIKANYIGLENLPDNPKCFFVANHPFGVADGLIFLNTIAVKYNTLKAIGNEAFMFVPQIKTIIAAVNVFGKNSKDYIMELEKVYNSNEPIVHFPAGLVSRIIDGKIQDSEWQKSFVTKAIKCERDVVPIYFHGKNSNTFYSIFRIRKFLGIKTVLELMLLPSELFKKKNKTITVVIGKPISYKKFDNSRTHSDWASWVKSELYYLKEQYSEEIKNTKNIKL
ncbi:MAG: glycerol acyltransferase [Bacteroidales bacterium]|nr:glycerol acyltransferase [Bacteroidales bacterium]